MTTRFLIGYATAMLSLVSCVRETIAPTVERVEIMAEWEERLPVETEPDTKTIIRHSQVRWANVAIDKRIFVFDSNGAKITFTSNSAYYKAQAARTFSGDIDSGAHVKYVLWHGKEDDSVITEDPVATGMENMTPGGSATLNTKASLSGLAIKISGSCLALPSVQNADSTNSFATNANVSVMKEGDRYLKSVFGYLRFRAPLDANGHSAIKSVTIKADENMAGQIEIDYSGDDPVTRIVSDTSKTITVNTLWSPDTRYPNTYYAVIPAGTYHNMDITITTYSPGATTQEAPTNDPFTIYCRGDVVVKRGKYTDLGTLPVSKSTPTDSTFKFDTDYFEEYTDPVSGVVSYRIKSDVLGWDNSQSGYYVTKGMTDDQRFIYFMVSANEFRPVYHNLTREEESAKILDLETRKIYTFFANNGCYPYLDPQTDKLYYCIRNEEKNAAQFYVRDLLNSPDVEQRLASFPQELVPAGEKSPIRRVCSHITLTQDKTKVFLDAWVVDTFYQGLLDLYTGEWTEWNHNVNECNLTHAQLNPTRDDLVLLAMADWKDTHEIEHKMDVIGYDSNGTYKRMQLMDSTGKLTLIPPSFDESEDKKSYASHEGWHPDGNHVYWCAWGKFNIRRVSSPDDISEEYVSVKAQDAAASHCNFSMDKNYVVHDDNRSWGPYSGLFRGCQWRVWFTNRLTGKTVAIYSGLKPITVEGKDSKIHPDPHPHFVAGDNYIICTAAGDDGNVHWSITPVSQLIAKTQ